MMKKKKKVMKIFKDYGVFILFVSQELHTIKGGVLGQLMKCKSSKPISKPKFPGIPDISGFLTGFKKPKPDMSSPQPRHVRANPSSSAAKSQPDLSGSCSRFQKVEPDMFDPSLNMSNLTALTRVRP
jgi:hypothetical protein